MVLSTTLSAEVRLPRFFSDHMVLQQQTSNAIWGWAEPGKTVKVKASWGTTVSVKASVNGKWKLFLKTPGHGTNHSLTITGRNTIRIKDVAIGEVWLCVGQSNMGWSMGNSFEAEKEDNVNLPNYRIFRSRSDWGTCCKISSTHYSDGWLKSIDRLKRF